jgi:hypothetical protein
LHISESRAGSQNQKDHDIDMSNEADNAASNEIEEPIWKVMSFLLILPLVLRSMERLLPE